MSSQAPIEYQRFRRGESCTEEGCRARKFYIEDGKKFCQRGHEQAGFTQTQQDEDDWNTGGKTSRKLKAQDVRLVTVVSGNDAKELYLQCLQLIIWKQCHWLIHAKGFPPELETIVRDLWGLRVGVIWKDSDKISQSAFSSQVFSSQSEGETSATEATDAKSFSSKRSRVGMTERMPGLRETLAFCYLGLLILRIPVGLGEVWKWATRDEIVFSRAITEIPREMRRKMPPAFHNSLELKAPLKGYTLHQTVGELIVFFGIHFEMVCPPLNTPLLLYKHIHDLGLPVEIYPGVQNLINLLSLSFSFPTKPPSIHRNSTPYPEILLISLVVIATKLLYPFDTTPRVPESDKDPSYTRIDWSEWSKVMIDPPDRDLKRGEEIHVKETDVWNMSGKDMDKYMDWYQRTWIEDDKPPKLAQQLLDMFPLSEIPPLPDIASDSEKITARLKAVQSSLQIQKSWPPNIASGEAERIHRPGELYKRYRHVEELPAHAKNFYELAAKNVGISVRMLVKEIFKLEIKLEHWRIEQRKRELFGEGFGGDEGQDEDMEEDL